jgi:hypothetical protein
LEDIAKLKAAMAIERKPSDFFATDEQIQSLGLDWMDIRVQGRMLKAVYPTVFPNPNTVVRQPYDTYSEMEWNCVHDMLEICKLLQEGVSLSCVLQQLTHFGEGFSRTNDYVGSLKWECLRHKKKHTLILSGRIKERVITFVVDKVRATLEARARR